MDLFKNIYIIFSVILEHQNLIKVILLGLLFFVITMYFLFLNSPHYSLKLKIVLSSITISLSLFWIVSFYLIYNFGFNILYYILFNKVSLINNSTFFFN